MKVPLNKPKHIELIEQRSNKVSASNTVREKRLPRSPGHIPKLQRAQSHSAKTVHWFREKDIVYKSVDLDSHYPQKLATLDFYYSKLGKRKPVVVFVHGGGWIRGDKENILRNEKIINFFLRKEYVVASVNFRLLLNEESPGATYKDQAEDITSALAWLNENAGKYNGKPDEVILFGYSSGAHLASLVSLDERFFARQGLDIGIIKGVIAMDVHAYDIPLALSMMEGSSLEDKIPAMKKMFGEDVHSQREASPINYIVNPGKPAFLIVSAGQKDGKPQNVSRDVSEEFKINLRKYGHHAIHVHFASRGHVSLVMNFGGDQDGVAKVLARFLSRLSGTSGEG